MLATPPPPAQGLHATTPGTVDKAIAAVLFQGGLRRSEAAAVEWRDVTPATTEGGILVTVRRSKTDQEGTAADVRYLKNGAAAAVLALRPAAAEPTARVFDGLMPWSLGRRFTAAAAAAGIKARLTAHSGRVGLASELTARAPRRPMSCWPGRGKRRAWSPTILRGPAPNAGPSPATSERWGLSRRRERPAAHPLRRTSGPRPRHRTWSP